MIKVWLHFMFLYSLFYAFLAPSPYPKYLYFNNVIAPRNSLSYQEMIPYLKKIYKFGCFSSKESYGTTYGDLELFLCGLDLSNLVDVVRGQHIDFNTFLRLTEEDLIKVGIRLEVHLPGSIVFVFNGFFFLL